MKLKATSFRGASIDEVVGLAMADYGPDLESWLKHKAGREIVEFGSQGGMVVVVLLDSTGNPITSDSYPG